MKHYLFAKNYKDFSAQALMEKCALPGIGVAPTKENFDLLYSEMCKSNFVRDEILFEKALKVII